MYSYTPSDSRRYPTLLITGYKILTILCNRVVKRKHTHTLSNYYYNFIKAKFVKFAKMQEYPFKNDLKVIISITHKFKLKTLLMITIILYIMRKATTTIYREY